jgi:hypothetical protein
MERQEEHLLAVLRERMGDEIAFQKTLKWLQEGRTLLAGSFPLWFVFDSVNPRLWHKKTKKEIYFLHWCSKQLNHPLPQTALVKIGHLLQIGPFYDEFHKLDLDFFSARNPLGAGAGALGRPVTDFDYYFPASLQYHHGQYALLPEVDEHVRYTAPTGTGIDEIRISCPFGMSDPINRWMDSYFDLTFCKVQFNGHKLTPLCQEMRGKANLEKYETMFKNIQQMATDRKRGFDPPPLDFIVHAHARGQNPGITAGGWHVVAHQLATSMEKRLEKYNRRRFTIENESDYKALINRIKLWAFGGGD